GFFGDLQLEPAHLLLLLLAALVAALEVALALVAALELLLAALHLLGLAGGQVLQTLVVLLQVHVAALARVHHLLLRRPGSGTVLLGLGLLRLGCGLGGGRLVLGGLGSGLLLRLVGHGLLLLPLRLGCGGGLGLPVHVGVDALDALHL